MARRSFTCAGQLVPYQRMNIYGTKARIDVEIPFNSPADRPSRIHLDDGSKFAGASAKAIEFPAVDQYTLQADRFADAVRGIGEVPGSLEDGIANMAVIDAVFRSADSGKWETPARVLVGLLDLVLEHADRPDLDSYAVARR